MTRVTTSTCALRRRLRADGSGDEAGIAMTVVVVIIMLMTLIPLAMVTEAVQRMPLSRHDQDHESALAAAEAGVDDYLSRLAQNQNYWTYNAANPPPDGNTAFTTWQPLAGSGTNNNECFRYNVNTSQTASTGVVYLTASGKRVPSAVAGCSAAGVIRTVKVGLRRQGFLDFLWLTDYEIMDPALSGANATDCKWHAWQRNTVKNRWGPETNTGVENCGIVYWNSSVVLNGPIHSNDGLYVCGNPTFNGDADTYYNSLTTNNVANSTQFGGPGTVLNPKACTNTVTFSRIHDPAAGSLLAFPPANTSIKLQADKAQGGTGCLYTGPTTITLKNVGGVGKMNVTTSTPTAGNTHLNAGCVGAGDLSLPANGVIYVENNPTSGTDRITSGCAAPCYGDVNTSGTLNGQLTIASEDDIVITGNLAYHQYPGGNDVLGLIADNDVAVQHAANAGNGGAGLTIDAAILSLNHSFYVQNWDSGTPLGTLTINGVITQEFRGAVGTFNTSPPYSTVTGYTKNYNYDTRLKYLSPPYFLSPTQSAWTRISYAELPPNSAP